MSRLILFTLCCFTVLVSSSEKISTSVAKLSTTKKARRFHDVVTRGPCSRDTCRRYEDVITCCSLSALKELGQVVDGKTIELPKTIRLHIVKIKDATLCTDEGGQSGKCETGTSRISTRKSTSSGLFKRISGLTITKTSLEYISEDFFGLFRGLKHLVIDKNPQLVEIPAVNRARKPRLQTISYIGNTKVQMVKWNEKVNTMPELREFLFSNFLEKAGNPSRDFYMGPFTPGKKLKAFKIRLNYQTAHVNMPFTKRNSRMSQVYIGSTNIPENLKLNFTNFHGRVKEAVFNFPIKPDRLVPDFLPDNYTSQIGKVSLRFDGESYNLKNMEFRRRVPRERQITVTSEEEERALLEIKEEYGTPKSKVDSKGRYVYKYLILDTNDLTKLVKDSHNLDRRYIVKAHYLWIRDINYLRKSVKLHLSFHSLILSKGGALFSADVKLSQNISTKNKDFSVARSVTILWRQFDLRDFYDYLTTAASLSEALQYENGFQNSTAQNLKSKIASEMLEAAKESDVITSASLSFLPRSETSFVEECISFLPRLYAFTRRPLGRSRLVAELTSDFKERTLLYQEMAKTLITSERYERTNKKLQYGLKLLTETLKLRLDVLSGCAQNDMSKSLREEKESRHLLRRITGIRDKYLQELNPVKERFIEALRRSASIEKKEKYYEILSYTEKIFSDLFVEKSPTQITKRKHISRPKLLSSLDTSIRRVSNFLTSLNTTQSVIAIKYNSKKSNQSSSSADSLKTRLLSDTNSYFRSRLMQLTQNRGGAASFTGNDVMQVTSLLYDINIDDVFEWDVIMQRVDKLLDVGSLAAEIPDTLAFKTAFLRLLDTAKVESVAQYDVTKLQAQIFIGNYTTGSISRQIKQLTKRLGQITQKSITGKSDDSQDDDGEDLYDQFQTVRQSTIYQLKLDMLLHINDYCSFVEYGTASQCLLRKQFSLDASLPNILHLTSKLLVVSSGDFDEAGISPQTFVNVPIKYELNDQCHQIQQTVANAYTTSDQPPDQQQQQTQYLHQQQAIAKDQRPSPQLSTTKQHRQSNSSKSPTISATSAATNHQTTQRVQQGQDDEMTTMKADGDTELKSSFAAMANSNATKKEIVSSLQSESQSPTSQQTLKNTSSEAIEKESVNKSSSVENDSIIEIIGEGDGKIIENKTLTGNKGQDSEDLIGTWIAEKLGLPKIENAAKRSRLDGKPIRTLDGKRVRRTTYKPTFDEPQFQVIDDSDGGNTEYELTAEKTKRNFLEPPNGRFESAFRKCNASKIFEMRENRMVSLTISQNNKQFRGFDRVRVEEVKVYLHGVKTDNGFVQVNVQSESIMHDRMNGKKRNFVGKHWSRIFRYNTDEASSDKPKIQIKADTRQTDTSFNFYPTPFTTWVVSVSSEQNPGLDLSNLASIELLFTGTLVSSTPTDVRREQNFFETLKAKAQPLMKPSNGIAIAPTKKMSIITKKLVKKHGERENNRKHMLRENSSSTNKNNNLLSGVVDNDNKLVSNASITSLKHYNDSLNIENIGAKEIDPYVEKTSSHLKKKKTHVEETNPHADKTNSNVNEKNSHVEETNLDAKETNSHVEETSSHIGESSEATDFLEVKTRKRKPIITWLG